MRVLVVDDEPNIINLLRLFFERDGFEVEAAPDGPTALAAAARRTPDLVVLDIMMPGIDGLTVCRELRRESRVPIILLTARGEDVDMLMGFELGADDYVVKPFSPRVLVARARTILRRANERAGVPPTTFDVGSLHVDIRAHEVVVDGRPVAVRPREFDLLVALARDAGAVLSREELLRDAWGTDYPGETRTVDMHVLELRRKLGSDGPEIRTVRGVGYCLVPRPPA